MKTLFICIICALFALPALSQGTIELRPSKDPVTIYKEVDAEIFEYQQAQKKDFLVQVCRLMDRFKQDCYNDSTRVIGRYVVEYSTSATTKEVRELNSYAEYKHKEPTFENFLMWLDKELTKEDITLPIIAKSYGGDK